MKGLAILVFLCGAILISCQTNATNLAVDSNIEPIFLPTPKVSTTPKPFDIHSKIGIVDVHDEKPSCLRTKNKNLIENTPVSIIVSLDEPSQKVLMATVGKKLEESCARRASETGDDNPGENYFYTLTLTEKLPEYFGFDVGIAVIEPSKPIEVQNNVASTDLNEDGKMEFFRSCGGFEGTHFTIWTGKPLKGKRIWHSFYYVDYDTVVTCKKKDWEETEN